MTSEDSAIPRTALKLSVLLIVLLAAAVEIARAQTFRGTVLGTVLDQTEAPIPGAQITIKNQGTGLSRATMTDDAGQFHVPELPIGDYIMTIEKPGFETVALGDVRVEVAGERRVDVTLKPGRVESHVEVRAELPLVETTTNVLGGGPSSRFKWPTFRSTVAITPS